jgi:hypothetical protein
MHDLQGEQDCDCDEDEDEEEAQAGFGGSGLEIGIVSFGQDALFLLGRETQRSIEAIECTATQGGAVRF